MGGSDDDSANDGDLLQFPVKVEIDEVSAEDDAQLDHFLKSTGNALLFLKGGDEDEAGRSSGEEWGQSDDDDSNWSSKKTKRKKKVSRKAVKSRSKGQSGRKRVGEMTAEEVGAEREKWRGQRRRSRARAVGVRIEEEEVDDDTFSKGRTRSGGRLGRGRKGDEVVEVKVEVDEEAEVDAEDPIPSKRRRRGGGSSGGGDIDIGKKEAQRVKWREEARRKRQRQRENMTAEEREAFLTKQRDQKRKQRQAQRGLTLKMEGDEGGSGLFEDSNSSTRTKTREEEEAWCSAVLKEEARKAAAREQKRRSRALLTPEQKQEKYQKDVLRRIMRKANMTEEQKAEMRMKNYLTKAAHLASLPPEEVERRQAKIREKGRQWYASKTVTDEQREKIREERRRWRHNMNPEQRAKFLQGMRKNAKDRMERLKQDPEKWAEIKMKWKEEHLRKRELRRTLGVMQGRGKNAVRVPETPEMKERRLQKNRESGRKYRLTKKLAVQNLLEQGIPMEQIQKEMETPEQREKRLMKLRVRTAKQRLRKRLTEFGAPNDEIQARLSELDVTYEPVRQFRDYKPRQDWKPVDPAELQTKQEPDRLPSLQTSPSTSHPVAISRLSSTSLPSQQPQMPLPYQSVQIPAVSPPSLQPYYPVTAASVSRFGSSFPPPPPPDVCAFDSSNSFQSPTSGNQPSYQGSEDYSKFEDDHQGIDSPFSAPSPPQSRVADYSALSTAPGHSYLNQTGFDDPRQMQHHQSLQSGVEASRTHGRGSGPRGPLTKKNIDSEDGDGQGRTMVACDLCGHSYNASYISEHKRIHHNPNLVNGRCVECGEAFNHARKFFTHFRTVHLKLRRRQRSELRDASQRGLRYSGGRPRSNTTDLVVCEFCGLSFSSSNINFHKNSQHNPHFVDGKCTLCNIEFGGGKPFWEHFRVTHAELTIRGQRMAEMAEMAAKGSAYICSECGSGFKTASGLMMHEYHQHGEGSKVENHPECPVCQKRFIAKCTLSDHIRKKHPTYKSAKEACLKCDAKFVDRLTRNEHVKVAHPEGYHPCEYCETIRYSELGLTCHLTRCPQKPGSAQGKTNAQRKVAIKWTPMPCGVCGKMVGLNSLDRHFLEIHGVKEEPYTCSVCGKVFKRRLFWVSHMEMEHDIELEERLEEYGRLCVPDETKVEIKNKEGPKYWKGRPGFDERKKGRKKKSSGNETQVARGGRRKRKVQSEEEDEEDEQSEAEDDRGEEENASSSSGTDDDEPVPRTSTTSTGRVSRKL